MALHGNESHAPVSSIHWIGGLVDCTVGLYTCTWWWQRKIPALASNWTHHPAYFTHWATL